MKEKIYRKVSKFPNEALFELSNNKGIDEENNKPELAGAGNYTNSPLVNYTKISPNRTINRNHAIDTITIHCVVGQATVQSLGNVFAPTSRKASSNYGVGYDGKIGMYCEEKDRSWCSSSAVNDNRAITIETASDTKEPYGVKDAAYNSLINLVADICKRNGIKKLVWSNDKNTRINHKNGCNMTVHRDFAATACPGTYLYSKMGEIADKVNAKLGSTQTTTRTYTLVVDCNIYGTATDAKNKKNAKGKYTKGTYYIYNKYPDGYNGVYNITKDNTGNAAGAWINPDENKQAAPAPQPSQQKLYRVRKSKDDAKTQYGAYANLQNAIDACQAAGPAYSVFDWDYKVVYSYTTPQPKPEPKPEPPKEDTTPTAVYDCAFPSRTSIITTVQRTNEDCVKAIKTIQKNNTNFDIDIAKAFFKIAPKYKIDPIMVISQSILETGWFKFEGSSVKAEQHNYCGLGATGNGVSGASFNTIEDGVTAQCQHLYAYGCKDNLPSGEKEIDPRFKNVTRGIAPLWEQLAGRWAVPGYDNKKYSNSQDAVNANDTYGQKILLLCNQIIGTSVTTDEIEKYFPKDDNIDIDNREEENKDNVNAILKLLRKLLEFFLNLFKVDEDDDE